jgi:hypothetical protein
LQSAGKKWVKNVKPSVCTAKVHADAPSQLLTILAFY